MPAQPPAAGEVLDAVSGMVRVVLDRANELGVDVTAEQVASNLLPNLGQLAGDMLAHHRQNGSLDGVELTLVAADTAASTDRIDVSDDSDGM